MAIVVTTPPIIELPPEPVVRQEVPIEPPEPTLEEKIKGNYYKCTESQYIRADNAQCKDKPVIPQTPVRTAQDSSNTYSYRSCTWYVKQALPWVANGWGNANQWAYTSGYALHPEPIVGAIGWSGRGEYGHVVAVLAVRGGEVYIRDGNFDWSGSVREHWVSVDKYQYLY